MIWKYFRIGEYQEALVHTSTGGIAIIESENTIMGKPAVHLYADTRRDLMNAGEEVGLSGVFPCLGDKPFFELFGEPLARALRKCMDDEGKDFS